MSLKVSINPMEYQDFLFASTISRNLAQASLLFVLDPSFHLHLIALFYCLKLLKAIIVCITAPVRIILSNF